MTKHDITTTDAIRHAEKVIQLAASDEHRKNFSLPNIDSADGKGEQYFLPVAHSDVGGGYVDGATEKQIIFIGCRGRCDRRAQGLD